MTVISRVPIIWSGAGVVGGGFSVLHCAPGDEHALMSDFRTFCVAVAGSFPTAVTWSFPSAGPKIEDSDGSLVGAWSDGSAPVSTGGTSANTWANGVGARVKWTTGAFHGGHRIVGSTFLVPLQINAYEGSGNIIDSYRTVFQTAASALATAGHLLVFSRPRTGLAGASAPVLGADFPDKVSWLRGRRT